MMDVHFSNYRQLELTNEDLNGSNIGMHPNADTLYISPTTWQYNYTL